jgi:hypothetical protein
MICPRTLQCAHQNAGAPSPSTVTWLGSSPLGHMGCKEDEHAGQNATRDAPTTTVGLAVGLFPLFPFVVLEANPRRIHPSEATTPVAAAAAALRGLRTSGPDNRVANAGLGAVTWEDKLGFSAALTPPSFRIFGDVAFILVFPLQLPSAPLWKLCAPGRHGYPRCGVVKSAPRSTAKRRMMSIASLVCRVETTGWNWGVLWPLAEGAGRVRERLSHAAQRRRQPTNQQ